MPGFADGTGVAVRDDGSIDASSQLFRASFVGVETGPMVSQVRAERGGRGGGGLRCPAMSRTRKRKCFEGTYGT